MGRYRYTYTCNRQILLSMLVVAIIVVSIVGVSFAFFQYTRTGARNTIQTGTVHFNSSQSQVNVVNAFPISKASAIEVSGTSNTENVTTSIITISGDTSYEGGLDFRITAQSVTKVGKTNGDVPISVLVTKSGNISDITTYDFEDGSIVDGSILAIGHIVGNGESVSEEIIIKSFIDIDLVAVSDTYDETESDLMGTTSAWVHGRTVLTTTEWNNLKTSPVSFKIRVEAMQTGGEWAYSLE